MSEPVDLKLRNATRFLAMYNNRLRAAFLKIAERLEDTGWKEFAFASPMFDWPKTSNWRGAWIWDFMPLTCPQLTLWKIKSENQPPWGVIFVNHIADSGIISADSSMEKEPAAMASVDECKTLWVIRYFIANAKASPIDNDIYGKNDWDKMMQIVFPDPKVWSLDLERHRRVELSQNNMHYGHQIFDAQEVLSLPDFEDKIMRLVNEVDAHLSRELSGLKP